MAKVTIDFEAKYKEAAFDIEQLNKEITKLEKTVESQNKKIVESTKKVEKNSSLAAKGVKRIGTALKGLGIGLVIAAVAKLGEVFNKNQKVVDFFNIAFESLSIAFNDFFNFLEANLGTVVGYFKSIFSDPVQAIKDFGNAILDGVINRFKQAGEVLGRLSDAFAALFAGEFTKANILFKDALVESVDVITGVDDTLVKVTDTITEGAKKIADYTSSTIDAATAQVELNKQAEIGAVINQGLIEQYDRQAEQQRQIRDNDLASIQDRIEANEKLAGILDKQEKQMLANVEDRIKAAEFELAKNEDNIESQIALQEALNERAAIEAQVEGFRSEQLTNRSSLERELLDLNNTAAEGEARRRIELLKFNDEQITGDYARLLSMRDTLNQEIEIERERLTAKVALYKEGTQARADAEQELADFEQTKRLEGEQLDKLTAKAKFDIASQTLGNLAAIFGEESKAGKAAAIAQTTIDTYAAAQAAYKSMVGIPVVGPALGAVAAAAAVASGIANVKKIQSIGDPVDEKEPSVAGPRQAPAFNIVGSSPENQLAQAIGEQQQQPVKAFVVSSEVTNQQALDRNIVENASLG